MPVARLRGAARRCARPFEGWKAIGGAAFSAGERNSAGDLNNKFRVDISAERP